MKNRFLFLLYFVMVTVRVSSQNTIDDAIKLRSLVKFKDGIYVIPGHDNDSIVISRLCKYLTPLDEMESSKDYLTRVSKNPFWGELFDLNYQHNVKDLKELGVDFSTAQTRSVLKTGGISPTTSIQTAIIDGTAQFMVERAKAELMVMFLDRFKDDFLEDKLLAKIFPNTARLLNTLAGSTYQFDNFQEFFQAPILKDLSTLPNNLRNYLGTQKDAMAFNNPLFPSIMDAALQMSTLSSVAGSLPSTLANTFNSKLNPTLFGVDKVHIENQIEFFKLVSNSFVGADTAGSPVFSANQAEQVLNDPITNQIYLGLLYEQVASNDLKTKLTDAKNKTQLQNYLQKVIFQAKEMEQNTQAGGTVLIGGAKTKVLDVVGVEAKQKFTRTGLSTSIVPDFNRLNVLDSILDFAEPLQSIQSDFIDSNINAGFLDAANVLVNFINRIDPKTLESLGLGKSIENLLKYGSFALAMAHANSAEQVKKALEAVALPVGSSRIKRDHNYNIAINGYLGVFGGGERMFALTENRDKWTAGVAAPIGITFSLGNIHFLSKADSKKAGGESLSIMFSAIDIGAVTAFRFADNRTELTPGSITFKSVLSPGAFLIYGFKRCPISIGAGIQYGPQLRKVETKPVTEIVDDVAQIIKSEIDIQRNEKYLRYSIFVAIDIPFFNLYTSKH